MQTKNEFNEVYNSLNKNIHSMATKITNDFIHNRDIYLAFKHYNWLINLPLATNYREYDFLMFENLFLLNYYEESLTELNERIKEKYLNPTLLIKYLIKLCFRLKRNVVNSYHIYQLSWGNRTVLTKFGQNNLKNILETLDVILKINYPECFFLEFYNFNEEGKIISTYHAEFYHKYYRLGKQSKDNLKIETSKIYKKTDGTATINSVENAIFHQCTFLMREAENSFRLSIDAKRVGEGNISETELYYNLKKHFSNLEIFQHGKPDFLGRQHFDVWIPKLNIAVEYQGEQHDRPIDYFGGEEAFIKNQKRDEIKREKCKENNVVLIEVRPDYDLFKLIEQIESISIFNS